VLLRRSWLALLLLLLLVGPARALDEIVSKRAARVRNFRFVSGQTVPELELGFEVYGRGDWRHDPVILVCHFLAGDAHAAGRYAPGDARPGWWDRLIGPGRPLDTDRFVVISTDLPCALKGGKDPRVISPGPASIDPTTGRRWGTSFPDVTVRDMVRLQKALLDLLGVPRLRAVTGPSMGGMLAWQWAVEYPGFLDQVIPVAGPVTFSGADRQGFINAGAAVMSDPSWLGGAYYDTGFEPAWGLAHAMYGLSMIASGEAWDFYWNLGTYLDRVRRYDANAYLDLVGLHATWELGQEHGGLDAALGRVRARVTVIGADDDPFIEPDELRAAGDALRRAGVAHEVVLFPGTHGHLSVLEDLDALAPALEAALR
jgi:homoserine O-acetyltransferase